MNADTRRNPPKNALAYLDESDTRATEWFNFFSRDKDWERLFSLEHPSLMLSREYNIVASLSLIGCHPRCSGDCHLVLRAIRCQKRQQSYTTFKNFKPICKPDSACRLRSSRLEQKNDFKYIVSIHLSSDRDSLLLSLVFLFTMSNKYSSQSLSNSIKSAKREKVSWVATMTSKCEGNFEVMVLPVVTGQYILYKNKTEWVDRDKHSTAPDY